MLRRASEGPYQSPAELKAQDEGKDTVLLLLGAAAIVGFTTIAMQWTIPGLIVTLVTVATGLRAAAG